MILYIQTAFLGDLLLSIPTLKKLREIYPDQKIHLLCRKGLGSFLKENQLVDEVFDAFQGAKPTLSEVRACFRGTSYDLLICPHESFRSLMISKLIQAKTKIGFESFLGKIIFDQSLKRPMHWPEALRQMSLLSLISEGVRQQMQSWTEEAPFQKIPPGTSMLIDAYQVSVHRQTWKEQLGLKNTQRLICLAPGSVWPTKQWGQEKYQKLAAQFVRDGYHVVLVGSASEKEMAQEIARQTPAVINRTGQTSLQQLAQIIAASEVLVCNDSGAMHMAAMVGTPTVSIFGPTVQRFGYQPWNPKAVVVENKGLQCRPCAIHGGKVCPIETHECMKSIPVELVKEAVYNKI